MTKHLLAALAFLFIAGTSFAQTQSDMNEDAFTEYKKAEKEINTVYQKILKEYSSDAAFIKNLRAAQRLWIQFRDAEVAARYPGGGSEFYGSVYSMCVYSFMTDLTKERTRTLKTWLTGIPEGDACSGSVKTKE